MTLRQRGRVYYIEEGNWIAAGETGWLTFVVQNIFTSVTQGFTDQYADYSSLAVWLIVSIIQAVNPVRAKMVVNSKCDYEEMDWKVNCHAGDVMRFLLICGISRLVFFLFTRLLRWRERKKRRWKSKRWFASRFGGCSDGWSDSNSFPSVWV